jgi:protein-arginine kinase activator protein McsA
MSWLSLIGIGFKFLLKLMDFFASREPTLKEKIADKRDALHAENDKFKKNLKEGNYEEASHQLRDVLDDIELLKRMRNKKESGSS